MIENKCCETCKYFLHNKTFSQTECINEEISIEEIDNHFNNFLKGCKHWKNYLGKEV